jgi:predicted Zn-dependent protease
VTATIGRTALGFAGCRRAVACLVALLLAGCGLETSHFEHQNISLPDLPKQAESAGQREHQRILAAYGGAYQDARLEALIGRTVNKLVAASERPDLHYKVTILNSSAVNAFALPTGQLYVTRGLLALANDTSELASVLAHEMAHVIARHAAIREEQARQVMGGSHAAAAAGVLNDPQVSAMALAKSKITLATFSRDQELEADGIGVGISSRAGYDPYGAVRFLTAMSRNAELRPNGDSPQFLDFLSSHPTTPDRLRIAQANAKQYVGGGPAERDRGGYLSSIDGLVYGEDPSEGFVRGRRFLHPRLGFTFAAPEGFTLENTAQAVLGVKEGAGQALRLDVVHVPADQSLTDYLGSGWIENIDPSSIEMLTINGFPAATAVAKGDQWSFRLYAIRYANEVYRFIFASKQPSPVIHLIFRESVGTFRRLTPPEIESAKPLRVKIVTVGPDDTPERLSSQMALADRPLERFLVLNDLQPGSSLKPGDQVKIIVE